MSPSTETRENREFASEIKFLVASALADQICAWTRGRLVHDPNAAGNPGGACQITSLYFDTEQFDVLRRRGSFGRSKYCMRTLAVLIGTLLGTRVGSDVVPM